MKESDLTSSLLLNLRKNSETWWYKIPDPSRCPGCGMIALVSKRPFDVVGCVNGNAIALEIKRSAGIELAPHQLAQLRLFAMARGAAFKVEKDIAYEINGDGSFDRFGNVRDIPKYFKRP